MKKIIEDNYKEMKTLLIKAEAGKISRVESIARQLYLLEDLADLWLSEEEVKQVDDDIKVLKDIAEDLDVGEFEEANRIVNWMAEEVDRSLNLYEEAKEEADKSITTLESIVRRYNEAKKISENALKAGQRLTAIDLVEDLDDLRILEGGTEEDKDLPGYMIRRSPNRPVWMVSDKDIEKKEEINNRIEEKEFELFDW